MKLAKAVIPAAGLGTRFLPATKSVPKELLPVASRPAIEYVVRELADSGIQDIIFVIAKGKEAILDYFTPGRLEKILAAQGKSKLLEPLAELLARVRVRAVYQDEPRGLGHAVGCAREAVGNEPFAVVLPDDLIRSKTPCLKQLLDVQAKTGGSVLAVTEVPADQVQHYGIVAGEGMGQGRTPFRVGEIVEKPTPANAPSRWAIIGRYVLDPSIFPAIASTKPGALGEIQITDALRTLAEKGGLFAAPYEGERLDTGTPAGFVEANLIYAFDDRTIRERLRARLRDLLEAP